MAVTHKEQTYKKENFHREMIHFDNFILSGKKYFGSEEIETLRLRSHKDIARDTFVIQWSAMCRGEKFIDEYKDVTFEYPINWWEQFKYVNFPEKWLKKWPVKWAIYKQTVHFKSAAVYPKLSEYLKRSANKMDFLLINDIEPHKECHINVMEKKDGKEKRTTK